MPNAETRPIRAARFAMAAVMRSVSDAAMCVGRSNGRGELLARTDSPNLGATSGLGLPSNQSWKVPQNDDLDVPDILEFIYTRRDPFHLQ